MAFAASLFTSVPALYLPSPRKDGLFSARFRPTHLIFQRHHLRLSLFTVACASRSTDSAASQRKNKQQFCPKGAEEEEDEDEGMDDDAFKALFMELEKDLNNDTSLMDDEITEEDFVMLERSLAEALGSGGDDIELTNSRVDNVASDDDEEEH